MALHKNNLVWKGYILSISALLLFSVIIGFARETESMKQQMKSSYHNAVQVSKLNYMVNDISTDMQNLVFADYMMQNYSSDTYLASITDSMSINKTSFLSSYSSFLQGYGNVTGANISFSYSDPLVVSFNNSMVYSSKLDGTSALFKNSSGPSVAAAYNISISANAAYTNYTAWSWTASGTYINIFYTDPSNNFNSSGYINSSVLNQFVMNYPSGSVKILAGLVDGAGNSIGVNQTLPGHLTSVRINSTQQGALPISYNTGLNVSYLNANYSSNLPA